jgi:hypothetical protein
MLKFLKGLSGLQERAIALTNWNKKSEKRRNKNEKSTFVSLFVAAFSDYR